MDLEKLYRVEKKDLPRLEEILNICFAADPLYQTLIPDGEVRKRLMPELFRCDMDEMFATCEIFANSPELNGLVVVSDEGESYNMLHYLYTEAKATLMTEAFLVKEDTSLQTLHNFKKGIDYLNSRWTDELPDNRLHIVYLAVDPELQHHGIAAEMLHQVMHYADEHGLMVSLETHNEHNVPFYQNFGFDVYRVEEHHFPLKQYCLVRQAKQTEA